MELEGGALRSRLGGAAREEAGRKKVHGVPNPIPAQNTVRRSQQSHNHTAGQTAFEPGGNRIDLDRQRSAMEIGDASGSTVTHSWDSAGRTSRNQPTAPVIVRTAPRTLTEALVTGPAKSNV